MSMSLVFSLRDLSGKVKNLTFTCSYTINITIRFILNTHDSWKKTIFNDQKQPRNSKRKEVYRSVYFYPVLLPTGFDGVIILYTWSCARLPYIGFTGPKQIFSIELHQYVLLFKNSALYHIHLRDIFL